MAARQYPVIVNLVTPKGEAVEIYVAGTGDHGFPIWWQAPVVAGRSTPTGSARGGYE
jgi:hypothetical protein